MVAALVIIAITFWFAAGLLVLPARTEQPLLSAAMWPPAILLIGWTYVPQLFLVERADGKAILEQGLTTSNIISIAFFVLGALYAAYRIYLNPSLFRLPADKILFPYALSMVLFAASTAWSIAPAYTLYRSLELVVYAVLALCVFDRLDYARSFLNFHAALILAWMVTYSREIALNLSNGIMFSAGKNNLLPLMCVTMLAFLVFWPRRHAVALAVLAIVAFILSGSAGTVGALPVAFCATLIASDKRSVQYAGAILTVLALGAFIVLMTGLRDFPGLTDVLSTALQKPSEELEKATGRSEFWPIFVEASAGKYFGSGFAAGERFVQLLTDDANRSLIGTRLGETEVSLSSAHNVVIGTLVTTGWLGICCLAFCLGSALFEAAKLDIDSRRYAFFSLTMLFTNGMTVPGIFGEANLHMLTWLSILCFIRSRRAHIPQGGALVGLTVRKRLKKSTNVSARLAAANQGTVNKYRLHRR